MERLTETCWRNLDPWECCGQDNYCKRGCHELGGCNNGCRVPKQYVRLAKYEDTGLSPEDVIGQKILAEAICEALDLENAGEIDLQRIRQIVQADKGGRLVVLDGKCGREEADGKADKAAQRWTCKIN